MARDTTVLIVPGWMGSGPSHWQSIWETTHPHYRRAALRDCRSLDRTEWVQDLERSISGVPGDVVLVAHSLGCLAVGWWAAARLSSLPRVLGAMLVAPPDLERAAGCLPALSSFTPVPLRQLPFPTLLVASENDPYAEIGAATRMAERWGSQFLNIGRAGHINGDSGHGEWPEGESHLQEFLAGLRSPLPTLSL